MNVAKLFSFFRHQTPTGLRCRVLSLEPYILHTGDAVDLLPLQKHLKGRPATFLISFWWTIELPNLIKKLISQHRKRKRAYPEHKFIYLCNTKLEEKLLREKGLNAIFCHQNALLDENVFRIYPEIPKKFDVVYDGQLAKFKRHHLCTHLKSLGLISYIESKNFRSKYPEEVKKMLPHAHWFNNPKRDSMSYFLGDEDIAKIYNECRVGLILSEVEGANYASVQYLLCGLPVVNTKNIGGRDEFLCNDVSILVQDNPNAVKSGVEELINRNISSTEIRNLTLERLKPHREKYISIVQECLNTYDAKRDFASGWNNFFTNKIIRYEKYADLINQIG